MRLDVFQIVLFGVLLVLLVFLLILLVTFLNINIFLSFLRDLLLILLLCHQISEVYTEVAFIDGGDPLPGLIGFVCLLRVASVQPYSTALYFARSFF